MKKSIACIAYKDKKILIAHRNNSGQMANRWEFPGGKVDEGETEIEAIHREMKEEFDVDVQVKEKIATSCFVHNEKKSLLEVYLVELSHDGIDKKYSLTEHSEYKWVDYKEIPVDNFVDSDLRVYPEVISFLERIK
jgi:8-oxo-dGTP diphosphatase